MFCQLTVPRTKIYLFFHFILFGFLFSEEDYKQVPKVDCGAKKLQRKYLPVIVNANDCFANLEFSSAYENVNLFDAVVNASAWTLPQSKGATVCHFNLMPNVSSQVNSKNPG